MAARIVSAMRCLVLCAVLLMLNWSMVTAPVHAQDTNSHAQAHDQPQSPTP